MTYTLLMLTLGFVLLTITSALLHFDALSWIFGAGAYMFGLLTVFVWLVGFLR